MTITVFQKQCNPGNRVYNNLKKMEGTVVKISRDRSKALVSYEDGSIEWNEYYLLEFPIPNP